MSQDEELRALERRLRGGEETARVELTFARLRAKQGHVLIWAKTSVGDPVAWDGAGVARRALAVLDLDDYLLLSSSGPKSPIELANLATGASSTGMRDGVTYSHLPPPGWEERRERISREPYAVSPEVAARQSGPLDPNMRVTDLVHEHRHLLPGADASLLVRLLGVMHQFMDRYEAPTIRELWTSNGWRELPRVGPAMEALVLRLARRAGLTAWLAPRAVT